MPTYLYRCTGCGAERELRRAIDDRDNVVMCLYDTRAMERQPAAPGFVLRGLGFHAVDYAKPRAE